MSLSVEQISIQVSLLIQPNAELGVMLPKQLEEIENCIRSGKGFYETEGDVVTVYAAIYEWNKYLEIGSVVTHPDFMGKGLATLITKRAIVAAKLLTTKPIIALTNERSTRLFEKLGFVHRKMSVNKTFWEPCKQTCVDYGRWPACNCHFMILDRDI